MKVGKTAANNIIVCKIYEGVYGGVVQVYTCVYSSVKILYEIECNCFFTTGKSLLVPLTSSVSKF